MTTAEEVDRGCGEAASRDGVVRSAEAPSASAPQAQEQAPPSRPDVVAPTGFYARRGKRALALGVIAVGSPLIVFTTVVICLLNAIQLRSLTRVFFRQERLGKDGRRFGMIKFRTMTETGSTAYGSWSVGGDSARVTPFGRLLRRTHLDELPQIYNILRGEMCLIGPRPELPEIEEWAEREAPGFSRRLVLRPGITGLAQIKQGYTGRDAAAYRRKLALNDEYRAALGLWTDLRILALTSLWMIQAKGWSVRIDR